MTFKKIGQIGIPILEDENGNWGIPTSTLVDMKTGEIISAEFGEASFGLKDNEEVDELIDRIIEIVDA